MPDREKVVNALANCLKAFGMRDCSECPYKDSDDCENHLMFDALALLKGQEAIKPTAFVDKDTGETRYECSNCGYEVRYEELVDSGIVEIKHSYCPSCGKKVKWDDK